MEGSITLKTKGFEAVREKLEPKITQAMLELGELTVRRAKENSAYQTGHNRRSTTLDVYMHGKRVGGEVESGFTTDESGLDINDRGPAFRVYSQSGHGGYLETGTKHMPAQPYIYPAFAQMRDFLNQELSGIV